MDDIEGDANNAINKTTSTEKECLDSEDFVSKKRNRRAESEPIPEKAVKKHFCSQSGENTGDASMIVELIKESNDRIEKKLDALEQKIIETINNSYRNDPVNTCQSKVNQTEKNDEIFRRDLASCKDLSFGYTSNIFAAMVTQWVITAMRCRCTRWLHLQYFTCNICLHNAFHWLVKKRVIHQP